MTVLLYVLIALGVLVFLAIVIVSSLPSPTVTQLVKRYLGRRR